MSQKYLNTSLSKRSQNVVYYLKERFHEEQNLYDLKFLASQVGFLLFRQCFRALSHICSSIIFASKSFIWKIKASDDSFILYLLARRSFFLDKTGLMRRESSDVYLSLTLPSPEKIPASLNHVGNSKYTIKANSHLRS